jgi:protein O-GlcNAc transferase
MGNSKRHGGGRKHQAGTAASAIQSAEALRLRAHEHAAAGRWPSVLEVLGTLIDSGAAGFEDWWLGGSTLLSMREYAQAAGAFGEALKLNPSHRECRYNLGVCLFQLGDIDTAVKEISSVAELYGDQQAWLTLATIAPGCTEITHPRLLEIRKHVGTLLTPAANALPDRFPAKRSPGGRCRVGYLSAFFHRSNYMKPVWGLINGHDRSHFDVHLFADDTTADQLTWFQAGRNDRVHLTGSLTNSELVALIRDQDLDLVIDLNGYSVVPRLEILTQRLAPVCAAWFNMYATSGLAGIDWIIGDEFVIRPDEEQFYSEQVIRLPQSYLSFVVEHESPDIVAPPCLSSPQFTFGSLVSQYKITPGVLDAWSEILHRCPNSLLILANRSLEKTANREYLEQQFQKRGVGSNQVKMLPPAAHREFLRYYDLIDVALDSFPYNGGTTTTEAIWQGVPVLTFDGDRWASRTSRTLLMNGHLGQFVATEMRDYIDTAVRWANSAESPSVLAEIRSTMRETLRSAPVCNMDSMVSAMEDLYRNLIRRGITDAQGLTSSN